MQGFFRKTDSLSNFLMRPVDASTVGAFRILFGTILLWEVCRYFYHDQIRTFFVDPSFHFIYEWFPWIAPWPGEGMYYHFYVMGAAAALIALGLFYRFAALVFFLTYTYVFLIEKALFNNHYYFICLIAFLLCLVNGHHWMSLDALWKRKFRADKNIGAVSYWNVLILKAQVFIVYFYGGIAKINGDWLRGEPFRHVLPKYVLKKFPMFDQFFVDDFFAVYFISYGGLIFDLAIGFILLYRKTRWMGIILVLFFNLTNNWLFDDIGIFPFLMIGATVLFLEPETPRIWLKKLLPGIQEPQIEAAERPVRFRKTALTFVSIYLAIQILLPFRHWLYEGNSLWTEEGRYFSWHMKVTTKSPCKLKYLATDPETGETWHISAKGSLLWGQYRIMCQNPSMIIQYAHYLGGKLEEQGIRDPIIKVKSLVSLNFRPPQFMIDPEANLMDKEYSTFRHADWILPLKEE